MQLSVFISYASEDAARALEVYDRLRSYGVDVWIDKKRLLPGQNWEGEIDRALDKADLVILLLSSKSVSKRGFVQREANRALKKLESRLHNDIYIVPILIDDCEIPDPISKIIQCVDVREKDAWDRIRGSLGAAATQLSKELLEGMRIESFQVFTERLEEKQDGTPGYEVEIDYPRFVSTKFPVHASELSAFFAGKAIENLVKHRSEASDGSSEFFDDPTSDTAKDCWWESFSVKSPHESILNVICSVSWYGAGAAHPNHHSQTFIYHIGSKLKILKLESLFEDSDRALSIISEKCVYALKKEHWERFHELPDQEALDWFQRGAGPDWNNFQDFVIEADQFAFTFPPYQVSGYSTGFWGAEVSFFDLLDCFRDGAPVPLPMTDDAPT